MTYKAMTIDLKKLQKRIAVCQRRRDAETKKGDLEMARMYEADAEDLTCILNDLNAGNYQTAWSGIERLETAVREEIPPRLYNFIANENGYC